MHVCLASFYVVLMRAHLENCCSCVFLPLDRSNRTDSPDWNKKYEVLAISRLYLSSLGCTNEQIQALSDDDMQRIADTVNNRSFLFFEEDVKFAVWEELKERGIDNQTEGGRDEWS